MSERDYLLFIEWLKKPEPQGLSWENWLKIVGDFYIICGNNFPEEDAAFASFLEERQPRRIVEWGTGGGYWTNIFMRAGAPDAEIVTFDKVYQPVSEWLHMMVRPRQKILSFMADSRDARTVTIVEGAMSAEPFDLIFIDSQHTAACCWEEYRLYLPLLRKGGIMAFHDIHIGRTDPHAKGVNRVWDDLKMEHGAEWYEFCNCGTFAECIEQGEHCYGIGAIVKK